MYLKKGLIALLFILTGSFLYAQPGLKIGIQGGLPVNEVNEEVGVVLGLDAGYMWALNEAIDLGVTVGFINGFPEKYHTNQPLSDLPNIQFAPIGGSVRIWPSNSFSFGVDAGQALGINDGNEGGLYYRPIIGFLMSANTELNFSYTGIELDGKKWNTVTLGVLCTFEL